MVVAEPSPPSGSAPARVLIVSRRTVRKNKFVNFVGEYHLELLVKYGVLPVIVPRVEGLHHLLEGFEPIHGVLLCEGEDVDPNLYYDSDPAHLTESDLSEIRRLHSSDVAIDKEKDSIELQLARRCMERNIPILGICRGSQILNVACGGSLYQDVETELCTKSGTPIKHLNYNDYDGHRHPITVLKGTPLHDWFSDSLNPSDMDMNVNSYHHQGVKRLAANFKAMAFSPCGLIEAFYNPDAYDPSRGKFSVGLQFHPERMRQEQADNSTDNLQEWSFDYPGCVRVYEDFTKAVIAYRNSIYVRENNHAILENKMEKYLMNNSSFMRNVYHHIVGRKRQEKVCSMIHNGNVCVNISRQTIRIFTTAQPTWGIPMSNHTCLLLGFIL